MLPESDYNYDELDNEPESDFDLESEPSLTYAMQINDEPEKDNFFMGKYDDEDAIRQAILKIINTERYEYEIYSWDYGIELKDLFGLPITYAMSEVKERIKDALLADDRIESVDDFEVTRVAKRTLHCSFTVITTQGEGIQEEMEVEV